MVWISNTCLSSWSKSFMVIDFGFVLNAFVVLD